MLSRVGHLTRLNYSSSSKSFQMLRQFSMTMSAGLSRQPTQLKEAATTTTTTATEEATSKTTTAVNNSSTNEKTMKKKADFQNRQPSKTNKNINTNPKNYNNNNIKNYNQNTTNRNNSPNNQQQQQKYNQVSGRNQISSDSNKYKSQSSTSKFIQSNNDKKQFNITKQVSKLEYNPKHQELYKEALYAIQNSSSNQSLVEACQKLNHLHDVDLKVAEQFNTDPIKPKIVKNILSNLHKMNADDFIASANFISRFEPDQFDSIQRHIAKNLANYNVGHLIKIVAMMRSLAYHKQEAISMLRELTDKLRARIDELESVADAKRALKLFAHESSLVQRIDMRLSQLADKLTLDEWIELLNAKSILRQRNLSILEICAYNIVKLAREPSKKVNLTLEQVQKCLLSCGILNYHEMSFYTFLLSQFHDLLSSALSLTSGTSSSWTCENEHHLLAIITSLGMLQLRDEQALDTLCLLLKANSDQTKLIVSFIQTCGALNYTPKCSTEFGQIVASVTESAFNLDNARDRANYLNYVWSLCALNKANQYLIASVLEKKFFDAILNDNKAKDFKSNLLKILNINMHSMFRMENYEGPNLPENFNLAQYSDLLGAKKTSNANETLISTLAGFRSINKHVKVNLLTSFGILIDAFMIVDKNGNPQPLDKFLSKDSPTDISDDEKRIAFKLIGFKEQTLIKKSINGITAFQLSLLKEVGYHPVIVYQEELQSASLTNRVELIQKKLKEVAKK